MNIAKTTQYIALISSLIAGTFNFSANANSISIDDVSKDIHFLASDDLKGRKNFSPEIDKAADYIATQFQHAGLTPLEGELSFKQHFEVTNITVVNSEVLLNKQSIAQENLIIAATLNQIAWRNKSDAKLIVIGEKDNFSDKFKEANLVGDSAIVLVHPAHEKIFKRFQHFLNQGVTKLNIDHKAALVAILTEQQTLETFSVKAATKHTKQKLTNVVGMLPGKSEQQDIQQELVLFSAHYDHLGSMIKGEREHVYNGANDNASGTSAVINLAKYFAKQADNQRTLVFAAFTAEEIGGYGSKYFSQNLLPEQISAMINIEMIGQPSSFGAGEFWLTGYERSNLGELLNQNLETIGQKIHADPYPKYNLFYRSDNATLARLGVPAHTISSSTMDKDENYHQPTDTVATLNFESMTKVVNAIATASTGLVDGSQTPTRVDTSKVKPKGKIF